MTQQRIWDYNAPEDTEILNSRFRGVIRVGVHSGFEVENGASGFVTIRAGVLVTAEGVRIEETAALVNYLAIPVIAGGDPRIDYIVCRHQYVRTVPPPPATYSVIVGVPDALPEPPTVPEDAVILARGLLPGGATSYSEIKLATPDEVFNASFDARDWRIVYGNKSAYRIEHDINTDSIRFYIIPAGVYSDGDIINWGSPAMTLGPSGHEQLNVEIAARQAAEAVLQNNIDAEAANRAYAVSQLQNSISSEATSRSVADTAIENALTDAKGRLWDEAVPANENMAELGARVNNLEISGGVPAHAARHESGGDDQLNFDNLADGASFVKMDVGERTKLAGIETGAEVNNLSDSQANDLSDGGDCTVHHHDSRYYAEHEIDAQMAGKAALAHNHSGANESQVDTAGLADSAVNASKLASSIAGSGLLGGAGSALSVGVDNTTIEINGDALRVKNSSITPAKTSFTQYFAENDTTVNTISGGSGGLGFATEISLYDVPAGIYLIMAEVEITNIVGQPELAMSVSSFEDSLVSYLPDPENYTANSTIIMTVSGPAVKVGVSRVDLVFFVFGTPSESVEISTRKLRLVRLQD